MWLVAYARNGEVCCCGWPESFADLSDCDLIRPGSEDERIKLLHELADIPHGHDTRRAYAVNELAEAEAGDAKMQHGDNPPTDGY